jgi:hypothetical protein
MVREHNIGLAMTNNTQSILTSLGNVFLDLPFVQNNVFVVRVFVLFVEVFQHSVKCVVSLLLLLNVGESDHVLKRFRNGFVERFISVVVIAIAESPRRAVVIAAVAATLL